MDKLNKRDLIEEVSEKAHLSKKDAKAAIETSLDLIEKALLSGSEVNLTNFGTFSLKKKVARIGTDPKTHKAITIKPTNTITFKLSKSLKDKLN